MMKRLQVIALLIIIMVSTVLPVYAQNDNSNIMAKVIIANAKEEVKNDDDTVKEIQNVTVRILEGEYENEEYEVEYLLSENIENTNSKPELSKGTKVLVNLQENEGEVELVTVTEIIRQNYLICMVIIFLILLIVINRKQSLKQIIIFLITIFSVYLIFILGVSKNWNLLLMSAIISFIATIIISVIVNGINKRAIITTTGTILGTLIAVLLAYVCIYLMKLSGNITDVMNTNNISVNLRQVIYSGIIMSTTGICLYIVNSIVSALKDIKQKNQNVTVKELFNNGIKQGMQDFAKIINILILSCLCIILVLLTISGKNTGSFIEIINSELISIVILYLATIAISGCITVPLESIIYAIFNNDKGAYKTKSDNIIDGQRSLKL